MTLYNIKSIYINLSDNMKYGLENCSLFIFSVAAMTYSPVTLADVY